MKCCVGFAAIAFAVLSGAPMVASAQTTSNPIATPIEKIPTDIRRTTVIVHSIERSLKFYRDALGLKINYDNLTTVSGPAFAKGQPGREIRLVLLNGNDPWIGWIGLIEYTKPPIKPVKGKKPPTELELGSIVIVTNVDDADKRCAAAAASPGARLASPTKIAEYPGREGGPVIRVRGCQVWDPDGILVELNARVQ